MEHRLGRPAPDSTTRLFCLTVSCPSKAGQVATIVAFLDHRQGYIDEFAAFDDRRTRKFFVRCVFHTVGPAILVCDALRHDFAGLARSFDMDWDIHDMSVRPKVLILVSRLEHCLADLLFRTRMHELEMNVVAIASNHETLRSHAQAANIPFHYLPINSGNRTEQETRILELKRSSDAELVILARYMQILSPTTSRALASHAINIHHSFLPGFKGAYPYRRAYERGVKVIGATAHFVTDDLDEGPIIEQVVEHVDHTQGPDQLQAAGRSIECQALARAIKGYIERRVFINGHRTIVL